MPPMVDLILLTSLKKRRLFVQEERSITLYCKASQLNKCTTKHIWKAFTLEPVCIISVALQASSGTSQSSRKNRLPNKQYCKADQLNNCTTKHFWNTFILESICIISMALEATSGTSQSSRKNKDSSVNGMHGVSKLLP